MRCLLQNARTIPLGVLPRLSIRLTIALREEIVLNLDEFHRRGASFIVIDDVIYPSAYRVAPHQTGIVRLQQFRGNVNIPHSGVEPEVVTIWIEDDGHSVVNG